MAPSQSKPVAAVIGVGPGLGASLARRFADKYAVAINARTNVFLHTLATDIRARDGVALEVEADISKPEDVAAAFQAIRTELGEPQVLLFNAAAGPLGNIDEVAGDQFDNGMPPNANKEDLLSPDAIAETYWHLAHQDRSAWTMELELRPFKEKF